MAVHDRLGVIVLVLAAAGALLGLLSLWRPHLLPSLRVYLGLTAATAGLQVVIGLVLVATGQRPPFLHWIYGAATLAAMPFAFLVSARMSAREAHFWIVGGAVATTLLAFRAVATG